MSEFERDKEWRKLILDKMDKIENKQEDILVTVTTMKVKIGFISGFFGMISGIVVTVINAIISRH